MCTASPSQSDHARGSYTSGGVSSQFKSTARALTRVQSGRLAIATAGTRKPCGRPLPAVWGSVNDGKVIGMDGRLADVMKVGVDSRVVR